MKVQELIDRLNQLFPQCLQEKYDNTGSQVLFGDEPVSGILLSLDIDREVLAEAREKSCNLILAHHPFFFAPPREIEAGDVRGDIVISLIEEKRSLFALHTNLDKMLHRHLAEVLELPDGDILFNTDKLENGEEIGFGTICRLENPITLKSLIVSVKEKLGLSKVLFTGKLDQKIKKIACINGAGGGKAEKIFKNSGVDCIVTGDVGYHSFREAALYGNVLIDAGHYGTERILLEKLQETVHNVLTKDSRGGDIPIYLSRSEKDPVGVY